jgi:2-aminoethylphosphonate-pyruvate transaminase
MTPLLLTPGPLTTSEATRRALLDDHGSRDPAFVERFRAVRERLVALLDTSGAFTCVPMQGSGTFAVEAMIGTLTPPGGGVLVCVNGAYGERAAEIAERAGRRVTRLTFAETEPVSAARLAEALAANPTIGHVVLIHSETTTGLVNPVEAVADVVLAAGRRLLIDAMSSFGALPLSGRAPIDAVASSANKCLEGVPGLGFVLTRVEALAPCAGRCHSVALDLHAQWRRLEQDGQLRFTPPTQVIAALDAALQQHAEEGGVAGRGARYAENRDVLIRGLRRLGLSTLLPEAHQGPIIVTVHTPRHPNFHFGRLYDALAERGFLIYPGKLTAADTFRVGCIGQVFPEDIRRFLSAVKDVLDEMGVRLEAAEDSCVQAVIFDWAGTVVDHGCLAPVGAFLEVFASRGVVVTMDEARGPMGTHKREHIRRMLLDPKVSERWVAARGAEATDADIDALYADLEPLALAALPRFAALIPGALETVTTLRAQGLKIGSTTGYNRAMLDALLPLAAAQGYSPDCAVAASEVRAGRPSPYMAWEAAARLGVHPAWACVKVGDTPVDMAEGKNAGMWAVGVAEAGNEVGLSLEELHALSPEDRAARRDHAHDVLTRAGAHLVIGSIADLVPAIHQINAWLAEGRRPGA